VFKATSLNRQKELGALRSADYKSYIHNTGKLSSLPFSIQLMSVYDLKRGVSSRFKYNTCMEKKTNRKNLTTGKGRIMTKGIDYTRK
jgi:hypothetical protein